MFYLKNGDIIRNQLEEALNSTLEESDINDVLKLAEQFGLSVGMLKSNSNGEIELGLGNDWVHIDDMGEVEAATGKYTKFLDIESSATELERVLVVDINKILEGNLDVLKLG